MIEIAPLAFMRGRTLNDSFVILDEAQNTTPEQMKMFLTRLGFGSRMVVTGDITQVDLPREQQSGLIVVGDVLDAIEGIEFVRFGAEDVVRHKLVQRIVEAYDVHSQREAPERSQQERAICRSPLSPMIEVEVFGAPGGATGQICPRSAEVRRLCILAAASAGVHDGHLAIEFVDAERIAKLNAEHRGRPAPTDVLSFPIDGAEPHAQIEPIGGGVRELGDVMICPEHTVDLREAIVHGVLHLMGMDHETDDGEMLALQRELLALEGG